MNLITRKRHAKIHSLFEHSWYGKRLKKLTLDELALIASFINERAEKDRDAFVHDVNRFFITNERTKNWSMIMEVLTIAG